MTQYLERTYSFKGAPYKIACMEPSPVHASWFTHEDESSVRDAQWDVRPGECILDVGAAYGSYTLTALAAGAKRAYAWSPQGEAGIPPEADFFEESLRMNGWEDRCSVLRKGAFNRDGWLNAQTQEFSETPLDEADGNVIRVECLDTWYKREFLPVEEVRLGSYIGFWLKLDVEGAEVEVLKGALRLIADLRPRIQVENHNFKRATIEQEVRTFLSAVGYREVVTTPYHAVSHSLYVPE